jgi:hypothetical protein
MAGQTAEMPQPGPGYSMEEGTYKTSPNSIEAQYLSKGDILGSGEEVVSVSAGARTPSGKVELTLTKDGKTRNAVYGKNVKITRLKKGMGEGVLSETTPGADEIEKAIEAGKIDPKEVEAAAKNVNKQDPELLKSKQIEIFLGDGWKGIPNFKFKSSCMIIH